MPAHKGWIVTASGDRPLSDVAKDLSKSGFAVSQVLGEIGCIIGSGGDDVAERLRAIPGVADVSPDHPIDIGPPDASITW